MTARRAYPGVDRFRLAAALLVICIHTAPLASFSETADFALKTAARLAVPFFFAATGFFVLGSEFCPGGRGAKPSSRLRRFWKKTGILYAVSTLLYLPVTLYSGNFPKTDFPFSLFRWAVWDGTFYHLWYLPAVLLGAGIVWVLARLPLWGGAAVCAGLYAAGVLGDSWFGLAQRVPALRSFYSALFLRMDYTRTGLFFAPLFLMLGAVLAARPRPRTRVCAAGFAVSLAALFGEAFALRAAGWPRFDCMYVSLPFCVYFLFALLLTPDGQARPFRRTWAMGIYLLHPLMIVLVRGAAKVLHAEILLIENSAVHFLTVAAASAGAAAVLAAGGAVYQKRMPRPADRRTMRAWAEIDLDAVARNAAVLRAYLPDSCRLMPVVKADAYGHGAQAVAGRLWRSGVRAFAVAALEEGVTLRRSGIGGEILILGWTDPARISELVRWRLSQTVTDAAYGEALCTAAEGRTIDVHLAIDTGMHRLGVDASDTGNVVHFLRTPELCVRGIFTHLCAAGSALPEDAAFTQKQLSAFGALIQAVREAGCEVPPTHVQASGGILNLPGVRCAYARPGLALYGAYDMPEESVRSRPPLMPALSLRARIVCVHTLPAGAHAGYECAFTAQRETRLAVVSIGYADGWPRALGEGRGSALVRGVRVPIVGRVCMDQLFLDVTDTGAAAGDTVTLIGTDGAAHISVEDAARAAGTIPNEILSRIGPRVERITKGAPPP